MKIKTILCAAAAVLALTSCNEGTNEYHSTQFYPVSSEGIVAYADQTVDSTRVISYDSWTLNNTADWFDVSVQGGQKNNISVTIPAGYVGSMRLDLSFQPNNTGKTRQSQLAVVSSFEKIGTVSTPVVQQPYLNISYPSAYKETTSATMPTFSLNLTATKSSYPLTSYVTFTVYTADATLTSSADWITPEKTSGFTASVKEKVNLTVQANTTGQARTATLTLTSNGISTNITVNQPASV